MGDFQKLRHAAAAEGRTRFFTGRACHRGHVAERYVRNGACVECTRPQRKADESTMTKVVTSVQIALSADQAADFEVLELAKQRLLNGWMDAWAWAVEESKRRRAYAVRPGSGARLEPTAKCQGRTLAEFKAAGWTDGQLVYNGYATIVPAGTEPEEG